MKSLILALTLIPSLSFALENCVTFPATTDAAQSVDNRITEVSPELSFANCPESVLYSEQYVARLVQVRDSGTKCVYKLNNSLNFICNK